MNLVHTLPPFLNSSSEMGKYIRTHDWTASTLGEPYTWPLSLQSAVGLMLGSKFPMFLLWGREGITLYNDGYIPILSTRHPAALAQPFLQTWAEVKDELLPLIEQAYAGKANYFENLPLTLERNGFPEQTWFTFSYSPIYGDDGHVAGMFCALTETTARVHAEKRQALVLQTVDRLRGLTKVDEITLAASELLGRYLKVPYVFYAEIDEAKDRIEVKRDWARDGVKPLAGYIGRLDDYGPEIISTLRSGQALSVHDVKTDARTAAYSSAYTALGVRAILALPLVKAGMLVATLNVYDKDPRHWTHQDLKLAMEIAERIWIAIERGKAEATLRANEARQSMLLALGDTLRELSEDPNAMMAAATKTLALHLGVPRVGYANVDENVEYSVVGQNYNDISRVPEVSARADKLDDYGPILVSDLRAGRMMRVDDLASDSRTAGAAAQAHAAVGAKASIAAPVQRHGRTVAFMFAHDDHPRHWTDAEADLIREVASRTWSAVERVRAEQALRQADQRKDEFLAMLAHELRNPLAPISSAAELLQFGLQDPQRIKATSEVIVRQVEHMTGLINDLLDVSRVTRGVIALENGDVDIKDVLSDAVEQVRPLIEYRGHFLSVHVTPERAYVRGDHKRLVQIFANLLTNSAKYTPDDGKIDVWVETQDKEIVVCVVDNGIGMKPELISSVFDLFAQAERSVDRSQGGLGLGLALVKSLVHHHGGSVSAHSKGLGEGSKFTVRLPRLFKSDEQLGTPPKQSESKPAAEPLRILVVDDNTDAAEMLAMLLETHGHFTTIENHPHAALSRAKYEPFNACLLDIGLPDMDGYELAHHLRKLPLTADAMFVAVTGYGQQNGTDKAGSGVFDHYLPKPLSSERLLNLLSNMRIPDH